MTVIGKHEKQPADVKDYSVDYADWLGEISGGDTLLDSSATVVCTTTPANTSLVVNRVDVGPKSLSVWLSGGTANQDYKVTIVTKTTGGRTDETELVIKVKDF